MRDASVEGHFKGFDDSEIFFQVWEEETPRAVILGIHGLGEHSGSYKLLAEGLKGSGFQLAISDLRGHGQSEGQRGVGTIDDYVLDSRLFIDEIHRLYPDLPMILLGHSMGGLILSKLVIQYGYLGAIAMVLSSPLMGIAVEAPLWKVKSASLLSKFAPRLTLHNEIPNKDLTHDLSVVRHYEADPLRHTRISSGLFLSMISSIDFVFSKSELIKGPLLLQQAGDDLVVKGSKAIEFFEKVPSLVKQRMIYDGFFHEIYNESQRDKPISDLIAWIKRHLK